MNGVQSVFRVHFRTALIQDAQVAVEASFPCSVPSDGFNDDRAALDRVCGAVYQPSRPQLRCQSPPWGEAEWQYRTMLSAGELYQVERNVAGHWIVMDRQQFQHDLFSFR